LWQNLVSMLNESKIAKSTEVVIAPSAVHLHKALTSVRPDVAVSAQVRLSSLIAEAEADNQSTIRVTQNMA
jgi:hypothetical protein